MRLFVNQLSGLDADIAFGNRAYRLVLPSASEYICYCMSFLHIINVTQSRGEATKCESTLIRVICFFEYFGRYPTALLRPAEKIGTRKIYLSCTIQLLHARNDKSCARSVRLLRRHCDVTSNHSAHTQMNTPYTCKYR